VGILTVMPDLQPQTVEQVLTLERRDASGWTSESQELFLSSYEPHEGDLEGLGETTAQDQVKVPEGEET
jgi:hypothetical protein